MTRLTGARTDFAYSSRYGVPVAGGDSQSGPPPGPRLLAAGVLSSSGSQVATVLCATVTSVLIARTIGPRGNGTFALVLTMMAVTGQVAGFGLPTGISYVIARRRWPLAR